MTRFHYKAIHRSGSAISGVLEAADQAVAVQQLRAQGHYPVALSTDANSFADKLRPFGWTRKPGLGQVASLTQELATLLAAGLELDRALSMLAKLGDIGALKEPVEAVREKVRNGATLADAIASGPGFPNYYASMVRAGEFGGTLEQSLGKLANYLQRRLAVRESITSALVYPVLLLITAAASVIIILVFVLPEFEPLFAEAGTQLPLATRVVLGMSRLVREFWWLIGLGVIAAAFGIRHVLTAPGLREQLDRRVLRIPVLGQLIQAVEMERFCRTLGVLSANGVALPTALSLTRDTLNNSAIAKAVGETATRLREGDSLARRLAQTGVFPAVLLDLVQIGEEAGKLDVMLLRQADLQEQRLRHTTERLLAILVPALTILLGFIVAGLIASMLVAILSINDLALH
jgi:general secretion pathway protein F